MIELNNIYNMDCLEGMQGIASKSVHLIVIDPPYNIKKAAWDKWKTVDAYVEWMGNVFIECQRVLKDNGSFYFFHNDFLQIVELQNWLNKNTDFVFKSLITLNKKKFKVYAWQNRGDKCLDRNWFPNIEYCLYYTFQDETGLNKVLQMDGFSVLQEYFKEEREKLGWNYTQCDNYLGIKASYCYWDKQTTHGYRIPEEKHYKKLQQTGYFKKPYEALRQEYEALRQEYEAKRYTFNKPLNITCVWDWEDTNTGKYHPTQKPMSIIEKIINASSNEKDTVLDCFMGSGTTAIACINTNRNFIGFEKEEKYYHIIQERIKKHTQQLKLIA
jgi:DNA modification methylase